MNKETIRIEDLSMGYNAKNSDVKVVASHINATIHSAQLTCLLGANGVGKSTLLRTLSAFQPKLDGKIYIQNKEIDDYSAHQLSKTIGVVLTGKVDVQNMSVRELVGLGRSPYTGFWGTLNTKDYEIVDKSINMVGISKLSSRMIQTLSDGERQKVMIAKALAQETPVIFLDEPTAFLDFPSKVEMMQLLKRLSREADKTIFLSTHDLELALQIADMLRMMNKEKGISIGSPRQLADNGVLGDYVERKGITFDKKTLRITIDNS